jgi:hypothetical protein
VPKADILRSNQKPHSITLSALRGFGGPLSVSHCRASGGLIQIAAWLALAVAAIAAFLRDRPLAAGCQKQT